MKKFLPALSLTCLVALGGCGNDNVGPADTRTQGASASVTESPSSDAVLATNQARLMSSDPVSTEGAVSLNQDCNFEAVDGKELGAEMVTVPQGGMHEFTGWVVDKAGNAIPTGLQLVVAGVGETSGVFTSDAVTWLDRAGVAETRGYALELAKSGFSFKVDTTGLPAGTYHAYVMGDSASGKVVCDPGRQFIFEG